MARTYQEHLVVASWRANHGYASAKSGVLDIRLQLAEAHLMIHLNKFLN
jgi:hypothetical protein